MRLSFLVSILVHVTLVWALLTLLDIVPEPRLPKTVYNVKILAPLVEARREQAPAPEVKEEPPAPKPKETVPKPKPKEKKPEKKPEPPKAEPKETPAEDRPMDLSVAGGADQTSISVDSRQFPYSYYLTAIERKVSENWFSSHSGRGEGVSCVVYFQLGRGGQVSGLRVEQSSGNPHFDRQALRAIQSAEPFPPLPRAFGEAWLGIHFTFVQKN
ncbi:MAG: TonB family protein [Candidatus Krumholzibacteria bacterium]|nr:TonB family protein [Candidatus Krumholzibacteria bacterium]